ncbi:hypothetical protein [Haloferula sp.]|uniref:hypothetical protein n=1 Tax=Haloferula sp. TaxID=2497595 RepID=UPI0032A0B646
MVHYVQQDSEAPLQFTGAACPQTFGRKMNLRFRNPVGLARDILNAGVQVILISVAIELALGAVAGGVGIAVWLGSGLLSGVWAGVATFAVGQALAVLVLDMTHQIDLGAKKPARKESDKEVLEALRKELKEAEQDADGDPL